MLVLRLVDHVESNDWHICPADQRFGDGAIVTLEALCGAWCFGSLTREGLWSFRTHKPQARLCPECLERYAAAME